MAVSYNEAVNFLALDKRWRSSEFPWKSKDKNRRPPTFECKFVLHGPEGVMEDVFVNLRYKESVLPGVPDTFNASLFFRLQRIVSLDENGARGHTNRVGVGRPYFGMRIGHPHLHQPVQDCTDSGYAEPINAKTTQERWEIFLKKSGISGAPELELPVKSAQMGFSYDDL